MRRFATLLALVTFSAVSTGCPKKDKDDDKKPAASTKPAPKPKVPKPSADKPKDKAGPGLEEATSIVDRGKAIAKEALGTGKDLSNSSLDEVKSLGKKIADGSKDNAVAAADKVNTLVRSLAKDPDSKLNPGQKIARMIVLMVPLVGPTKRFIDARALYESGLKNKDDKKLQKSRREALMAFVEAGLDIGTLGLVGSKIDLVATGFDKVLGLLSVSRKVSALVGSELKTFDRLLDQLLAIDEVRTSVDAALASGAQ